MLPSTANGYESFESAIALFSALGRGCCILLGSIQFTNKQQLVGVASFNMRSNNFFLEIKEHLMHIKLVYKKKEFNVKRL